MHNVTKVCLLDGHDHEAAAGHYWPNVMTRRCITEVCKKKYMWGKER